MRYVIIGGSAGGVGAVEAIREVDPIEPITVISDEPQYSRPMISEYLINEANRSRMQYRDDQFWEKMQFQYLTGRHVVRLNLENNYVELEDGDRIAFETLLIATGGKPIIPQVDGADKVDVYPFNSLGDAQTLSAQIDEGKAVVVLGGGLIGVSVADALTQRGLRVTIIELKDRILNFILDDTASAIIEHAIQETGVTVVTGQTIQRVLPDDEGGVSGVILTNGEQIPCDVLVVAIGVTPRIELTLGTPLKVNRGIVVDQFMRTNVPNVYACGDVAETYDFIADENRLLPLWPLAHQGGRVAGYNMAGKEAVYPGGTIMTALKYFDVPIVSIGLPNPLPSQITSHEELVYHDPVRDLYKKIVLQEDVIVGVTLVNAIDRAGIFLYLMKNRINVREFKHLLTSADFGLASLPLSLRKKLFVVN